MNKNRTQTVEAESATKDRRLPVGRLAAGIRRYARNEPDSDALALTPTSERQIDIDPREIAEAAYFRWKNQGCQAGTAEEDWLAAERGLLRAAK